jgi:hypothetical protein
MLYPGGPMESDTFSEYKHLMKEKISQFDQCRMAHGQELKEIKFTIEAMRKELMKESKEISATLAKIDNRLTAVEIKSGIYGTFGGAISSAIMGYISSFLGKSG